MLVELIVESLSDDKTITNEDKEIIRFGLENLMGNMLGIAMTLTIGLCYHRIRDALFLWFIFSPLRKNAGGFHASTKTRCCLFSAFMIIISFSIYNETNSRNVFIFASVLISSIIILVLAPIENPVKRLDEVEYMIYRIRSRNILALEIAFFTLAFCLGWRSIIRSIAMSLFLISSSLVMGLVKMRNHWLG